MGMPKPRTLIIGVVIALLVIAGGLLLAQDQETLRVKTPVGAADERFPAYLARLLGAPLTRATLHRLHERPCRLRRDAAAIEAAQHRISFETYVYNASEVADRFTAAFEAACNRGVRVRLVLDSIGASNADGDHTTRLERAGCEVVWFNRVASPSVEELNYRMHRKSLIVDGAIAFVGGIGVSDKWAKDTERGGDVA